MFQRHEPVPICHQLIFFLAGQLKHELDRKSFIVSLDLSVQVLRFYLVEIGNIPIDHDPLATNKEDLLFDVFEEDERVLFRHKAFLWYRLPDGMSQRQCPVPANPPRRPCKYGKLRKQINQKTLAKTCRARWKTYQIAEGGTQSGNIVALAVVREEQGEGDREVV